MKKKLYLESSVWNQLEHTDRPDYRDITEHFFETVDKGLYDIFVSDVVFWEIEDCKDQSKREKLLAYIERYKPIILDYSKEAQMLRNKYIEAGIMTDTKQNRFYDTAHVAIASVNQIAYLLTFNFDHLLKVSKIDAFNGVNILNGYSSIQLVSPELFIPEPEV